MMKNIKTSYARIRVPAVPGVYPHQREHVVYIRKQSGTLKGRICADRKFKCAEAAHLHFNQQPEECKV